MPSIMPCLALAGLLATAPVHAIEYHRVLPEQTALAFSYQQMGVRMNGRFRQVSARLRFDPAQPAAARAEVEVDLASIDTGSAEADAEVAGKPWFNRRAFPSARFVASTLRPLGGNRYEASGQLSIKGQTREVRVPVLVTVNGRTARFEGSFPLLRTAFGIGEGSWARPDIVADEVLVTFQMTASAN